MTLDVTEKGVKVLLGYTHEINSLLNISIL